MAKFALVIFTLLSSTFGNPVRKRYEQRKDFYLTREQVVDFSLEIIESGKGYIEKIEVDKDKQTELFQVPSHPGVDRSDVLHDFKHNLTMLRFPESKICYLFPLVKRQSTPKKLIRDLKRAKKMVITETSREDSTWILDGEVTDRSELGEEAEDFCARYSIYRVKEMLESMRVTEIETKERANRIRRSASLNGKVLCPGAMDLNEAYEICPEPKLKCKRTGSCFRYVQCVGDARDFFGGGRKLLRRNRRGSCRNQHTSSVVMCCKYACDNFDGSGREFEVLDDEAPGGDRDGESGDGASEDGGSGNGGSGEAVSQAVFQRRL